MLFYLSLHSDLVEIVLEQICSKQYDDDILVDTRIFININYVGYLLEDEQVRGI